MEALFQIPKPITQQQEGERGRGRAKGVDKKMELLMMEHPISSTLHELLSLPDEMEKLLQAPTCRYVRDTKAMASTPADVLEYPSSYVFVLDMPGLKRGDIKAQVEDGNILTISSERKREEKQKRDKEEAEVKYLRMERRVGKFLRKFNLPKNADVDAISAAYQDGVLTVTVQKVRPPEPKKPKTIEVKVA